ncbi:solute carrier family 35 member SLC35F1/F2/F6 [Pilaira anomala]|nr:solute carrier family 35 member SLC35F1/F2/F6 [Pilaira anomala]
MVSLPKRRTILAVSLGQLLSLCITGTSSASSALWKHYAISIPFTQNFCNYLLLTCVYFVLPFFFNRDRNRHVSPTTWQFFGFSFADVQANVLAVLAFKNTSVLSALVLSSWTIPCIMLLSTWFLNAKYSMIHIQSAIVCLIGLAMLIWGDTIGQDNSTCKKK